ncbi:hypothetical protein FACS1894172_01630 [Spirochaetia bacterium]|nr:hypothetical protein FACS1894172_01630 [Spirochaetia bacterium]
MWEKNYSLLHKYYPLLAQKLEDEPVTTEDIRIEPALSGDPTLLIRGNYIHSKRDPSKESKRLAATVTGKGAILLLGFGLGYEAESLREAFPESPCIIVDRYPARVRTAFENRNLEHFLQSPPVIFVLGGDPDAVIWALIRAEARHYEIIKNPALVKLDEEWYRKAEEHIRTWFSKDAVNRATLKRFGTRWVKNLAHNRLFIRDCPGTKMLEGILNREIPVLLIAAGPSLDEIADFLPAAAERCVIVTVDTALRFVRAHGVDPDFTVVTDPQYWNARHLDRCVPTTTALVSESAVYPSALRFPAARIFLRSSLFPLGRFLENRVDPKGILGSGGSVATTAWDFSRILGASRIFAAGLDLSFPDKKTHFKGALFEERSHSESNRFSPAETHSIQALNDGQPFLAQSAAGGFVLTDRRLSLYAAWFENRIVLFPDPPTIQLNDSGILIPGMVHGSIEKLLAEAPAREKIDDYLHSAYRNCELQFNTPEQIKERKQSYDSTIQALYSGLDEIINAADSALRALRNFRDHQKINQDHLLKKLDQTAETIANSPVKDIAGFLFPDQQPESEAADPFLRFMESSEYLYRSLSAATSSTLRELKRKCVQQL